jgi:hypothetical protein
VDGASHDPLDPVSEEVAMKHGCTLAVAASLLLVGAAAQAQSLADVARQEQERRKAIAEPARVYTDADAQKNAPLTTAAARPQPASSAPSGGATPAAATADGGKAEDADAAGAKSQAPPKDEAGWRNKVDQARDDLARSRRLLSAMEEQLVSLGIQSASAQLTGQKGPDQSRQQESAREVERLRADVQKYTEALSKLEGDARTAGIPPGWVR